MRPQQLGGGLRGRIRRARGRRVHIALEPQPTQRAAGVRLLPNLDVSAVKGRRETGVHAIHFFAAPGAHPVNPEIGHLGEAVMAGVVSVARLSQARREVGVALIVGVHLHRNPVAGIVQELDFQTSDEMPGLQEFAKRTERR